MNIQPLPLATITDWIEKGQRFALARFGDGEFACLKEQQGENCDGVAYSPEMAKEIEAALLNPRIIHCVSGIGAHYGADEWLWRHVPGMAWYDSDQVLGASMAGTLWPLRSAIFRGHMLYVGPERLRIAVQEGLGAYDLIEVPLTTAFEDWRAIARETAAKIKAGGYRLVGVSAGPTAKVLINHMATQFPDVTFIDFGSVWDMYAGTPTRSGPKRLTDVQVDGLAWKNFHWTRPGTRAMPAPSIHDLLAIPGLVKEAEAEFLYKMANMAPVGMMVELGTFRGRTAAVLARTGARVLSIDNYSYPHHPEVGEPAQRLAKFGLTADFRCADSRKVPAEVKDVALLYVDSEHVEAQINAELDAWLPLLVKGGIVVFHDYGKRTQTDVTRVVDKRMAKYKRLGQERSMVAFQC